MWKQKCLEQRVDYYKGVHDQVLDKIMLETHSLVLPILIFEVDFWCHMTPKAQNM